MCKMICMGKPELLLPSTKPSIFVLGWKEQTCTEREADAARSTSTNDILLGTNEAGRGLASLAEVEDCHGNTWDAGRPRQQRPKHKYRNIRAARELTDTGRGFGGILGRITRPASHQIQKLLGIFAPILHTAMADPSSRANRHHPTTGVKLI